VKSDVNVAHGQASERIMCVAAELFASKGYHATGISELSEAVGMGRGALYHHISSKEDLLFEINSRYLRGLIDFGSGVPIGSGGQRDRVIQRNMPDGRVRYPPRGWLLGGGRPTGLTELWQRLRVLRQAGSRGGVLLTLSERRPAFAIFSSSSGGQASGQGRSVSQITPVGYDGVAEVPDRAT
jgi:AcrR family transcriptional regulator